jgi:hypothetical protein
MSQICCYVWCASGWDTGTCSPTGVCSIDRLYYMICLRWWDSWQVAWLRRIDSPYWYIWWSYKMRSNNTIKYALSPFLSYPIHSRFSSEVPDVRSDQIWSTDPYWIRHNKLLHSHPVHITLNTAYFLHLVYPPFWCIGYAFFQLCFTDPFHLWLTSGLCLTSNKHCLYIAILCA